MNETVGGAVKTARPPSPPPRGVGTRQGAASCLSRSAPWGNGTGARARHLTPRASCQFAMPHGQCTLLRARGQWARRRAGSGGSIPLVASSAWPRKAAGGRRRGGSSEPDPARVGLAWLAVLGWGSDGGARWAAGRPCAHAGPRWRTGDRMAVGQDTAASRPRAFLPGSRSSRHESNRSECGPSDPDLEMPGASHHRVRIRQCFCLDR